MDSETGTSELIEFKPLINIVEGTNRNTLDDLPERSRQRYIQCYEQFMKWKNENCFNTFSEEVLITYIDFLSKTLRPTSLWTQYSMLNATLGTYHKVDISKYLELKAILKRNAKGYVPKKAKVLTMEHISRFIQEAPDQKYLFTKTALIFGISGACRKNEMCQLKIDDIEDFGSTALIRILANGSKKTRTFKIDGEFYKIYKKYANMRPSNMTERRFFVNYQNGRCTRQFVGINKFASVPKIIAQFLHLKNPELYTGQCLRRTSATIIEDIGNVIQNFKPRLDSNYPNVDTDESVDNEIEFFDPSLQPKNEPSTSSVTVPPETDPFAEDFELVETIVADDSNVMDVLKRHEQVNHIEDSDTNKQPSSASKTVSTQTEPVLKELSIGNSSINTQAHSVQFSNCYNNIITINIYNRINK